jgi:hypothetical protein
MDLRTPCTEWPWGRTGAGYGLTRGRRGQRRYLAHRVVWTYVRGAIPFGMQVCHRCDNPPCINVDHLFLGTNGDNQRDKVEKGRQKGGGPPGLRHHAAKVTPSAASEMRLRFAAGESQVVLARVFGVSRATVHNVVRGRHWTAARHDRTTAP